MDVPDVHRRSLTAVHCRSFKQRRSTLGAWKRVSRRHAEVKMVTVCRNGNLKFQMNDGGTRVWENLHINLTRHKVIVTDCFQGKIHCASCGNTYHRVNGANRWFYWYCIGKRYDYKGVSCHSVNFADYQLWQISAYILGLAEFDEAVFEAEIERGTALEDGSCTFHFYEGRTETWQKV